MTGAARASTDDGYRFKLACSAELCAASASFAERCAVRFRPCGARLANGKRSSSSCIPLLSRRRWAFLGRCLPQRRSQATAGRESCRRPRHACASVRARRRACLGRPNAAESLGLEPALSGRAWPQRRRLAPAAMRCSARSIDSIRSAAWLNHATYHPVAYRRVSQQSLCSCGVARVLVLRWD